VRDGHQTARPFVIYQFQAPHLLRHERLPQLAPDSRHRLQQFRNLIGPPQSHRTAPRGGWNIPQKHRDRPPVTSEHGSQTVYADRLITLWLCLVFWCSHGPNRVSTGNLTILASKRVPKGGGGYVTFSIQGPSPGR